MKITKPFTTKRVLCLIASGVLFILLASLLISPGSTSDKESIKTLIYMSLFLLILGGGLGYYGLFGGEDPRVGPHK